MRWSLLLVVACTETDKAVGDCMDGVDGAGVGTTYELAYYVENSCVEDNGQDCDVDLYLNAGAVLCLLDEHEIGGGGIDGWELELNWDFERHLPYWEASRRRGDRIQWAEFHAVTGELLDSGEYEGSWGSSDPLPTTSTP